MKSDRQERISALVQASGRVKVTDLSLLLDVSEMTVRRDLEELEDQGVLTRVHGGAVSTTSRSFEPGFPARVRLHTAAKKRIGAAAAALIRDGETLIIDAGTTTLPVAEAMRPDIRVRVMALSLHVADALADMPNVTLMIPGGLVRHGERSFVGGMAVSTFDSLTFDTVILTSGGVDVEAGVTEYEFDDAETKLAALRCARRKIVVADGSKLGAVAFVRLCPIDMVDIVVTDIDAPANAVQLIRAAGVEVILA